MPEPDQKTAERIQKAFYTLMRRLPTEWTSAIGSAGIRWNVRNNRPEIIAGARHNLRIHRPEAGDAEIDHMVQRFLDGVGRLMAEFAVIGRFVREGRVTTHGIDGFKAALETRPVIALTLHTGNWEVIGPAIQHAGIPLTSFYAPPANPFEREVAEATRAQFGVSLLSPDARGVRDAMRLLRSRRVVMIFGDEARDGRTMAPLFGRPPHGNGNLAIAARLARHANASIVVCHCERIGAARLHLNFSAPFQLPDHPGRADTLADVAFLNGKIEPIVLKHIDRWYFLDDSIAPLAPERPA